MMINKYYYCFWFTYIKIFLLPLELIGNSKQSPPHYHLIQKFLLLGAVQSILKNYWDTFHFIFSCTKFVWRIYLVIESHVYHFYHHVNVSNKKITTKQLIWLQVYKTIFEHHIYCSFIYLQQVWLFIGRNKSD